MQSVLSGFNQPGRASVLIDSQYGSTGKGLCAAYVAQVSKVDIATTNAAAQAGHTTILPDGTKFVTFHMPTAGVINKNSQIYVNSGAIIDADVLLEEMRVMDIDPGRVTIHPNAAVITDDDRNYERNKASGATKIASTQKGVGRALARKVMREGMVASQCPQLVGLIGTIDLNHALNKEKTVMVEIPQGFDLGNDRPFYPHCTSRIISVAQGFSDAGIHPSFMGNRIMTVRTFPIRVGNIVQEGEVLGTSGDNYPDQREVSWEDLGQAPEITTVTKRVRRVFTFSYIQYRQALRAIRPTHVFINFINYFTKADELVEMVRKIQEIELEEGILTLKLYGTGPRTDQVVEKLYDATTWYSNNDVKEI